MVPRFGKRFKGKRRRKAAPDAEGSPSHLLSHHLCGGKVVRQHQRERCSIAHQGGFMVFTSPLAHQPTSTLAHYTSFIIMALHISKRAPTTCRRRRPPIFDPSRSAAARPPRLIADSPLSSYPPCPLPGFFEAGCFHSLFLSHFHHTAQNHFCFRIFHFFPVL